MSKIYGKSEIRFSILWIIIYVVGTSIADGLSDVIGMEKLITFIVHIMMCIAMLMWIKKHNFYEKYGLCRPKIKASEFLYYIPLILLSTCNFWYGVTMNMSLVVTFLYVGSMLCVGFLEEVIFRGFLFKAMSKENLKSAMIVSSVTFGIGHIVNLFNGSGVELVSNLCQVCYAVAFGFLFIIIFHKGGSLWPCIITHSVINACSAFANEAGLTEGKEILISVILTVIAIVYTFVLNRTLEEKHR